MGRLQGTESSDLKRQPSDAEFIGAGSTPFNYVAVTEQLRYGGVLEAVRVARSGFPFRLPHDEFYTKYRVLANPESPITQELPRVLPKDLNSDEVRELCRKLIEGEGVYAVTFCHPLSFVCIAAVV